jgi:hypothetical protein
MLVRTGKLRGSIKLIRGSVDGATFTNTGGGIRIGIEDPEIAAYARVHNRGFPAKKIPARQFLGVSRNDIKAVDGLLRRKAKQIEALE